MTGYNFWPGIRTCGTENVSLRLNEACLEIDSYASVDQEIKFQLSECYDCPLSRLGVVPANSSNNYFVVDTSFPTVLHSSSCIQTVSFDDFGLYTWELYDKKCLSIRVKETPESFWSNIIALVSLAVLAFLLYRFLTWAKIKCEHWHSVPAFQQMIQVGEEQREPIPGNAESRARRLTRVASIDFFRGIAITVMIFVNYGGGQYSAFKHAPWNGLHLADVVFPFFIWIMGVSIVLSLRLQLRASINRKDIFLRILRRTLHLIILGIILNSGKTHSPLRIPGVLQRIGVTYFIVSCVELFFGNPQRSLEYGPWSSCPEIIDAGFQWFVMVVCVCVHTGLIFFLPVPGCPTGYLGPGGLAEMAQFPNCTGGASGYIDRLIFSSQHIYQKPTCSKVYESSLPYDPEGLLGIFNSIVMAFFGIHCGRIILCYQRTSSRMIRWLALGIFTGLAAGMLCSWTKEGGLIPVNKNLWSLSYVLATTSMSYFIFAFIYWVVDVAHFCRENVFVYAGMNSILIYVGHEIMNKQLPWRWSPWTSTHFEVLIMDVSATLFWLVIAYFLHRRNIFVKL